MTPGDLVWVPFPHVEDDRFQSRPALLVATGLAGPLNLCWAFMITAAANAPWPEDVVIVDHRAAGLPVPSRIRLGKIATLATSTATLVGRLPDATWREVRERLGTTLEAALP